MVIGHTLVGNGSEGVIQPPEPVLRVRECRQKRATHRASGTSAENVLRNRVDCVASGFFVGKMAERARTIDGCATQLLTQASLRRDCECFSGPLKHALGFPALVMDDGAPVERIGEAVRMVVGACLLDRSFDPFEGAVRVAQLQ